MSENPCLKYCKMLIESQRKDCEESCKMLETLLRDFIKAVEAECRIRKRSTWSTELCLNFTLAILVSTLDRFLDHIITQSRS